VIVIDTNVVSELMNSNGAGFAPWLAQIEGTSLFFTTITRAEIRYGIELMPQGRRRAELEVRAKSVFDSAADRTLAFDAAAADRFGEVAATRSRMGRPISTADAQIAAIALVHRATVATRNIRDFEGVGLKLVDPFSWEGTA